ncbi:MAG: hypothetical protein DSM106950_10540 [Stigonema ocellatum SAG 48.90 = DSM 106950]|nr:hypothetical protein [Stigonema ocellatum SAG 48.90 = DSM 106950]
MNNQKVEINNAQLSLLPSDILEQVSSTKIKTQLQAGTLQALKLLAAMETNREFLALLLELGEFRADHLRYLMGPLVFHRTPWAETVPDWLKTACIQDRFETIIDEYERNEVGEQATATEILAYMMPATYVAPIPHSYFSVYAWCFDQVVTKHNKLPSGVSSGYSFLDMRPVDFDSIKYDYSDIARSIRRSVVRHATQAGWGKRAVRTPSQSVNCQAPPNKAKSPPSTPTPNQPSEVQLKLF